MKKTLIALSAIAGLALSAQGATIFTTTTPEGTNRGNGYYGFTVSIADTNWTNSTIPSDISEVNLESITLLTRDSGDATYTDDIKIAVYTYNDDGTTGTFLGLSDAQSYLGNNQNITFNFDTDIVLTNSGSTLYQFMFVSADATADDVDTFDEYKEVAKGWSITVTNNYATTSDSGTSPNIPKGWGTYTNGTVSAWGGQYLPVVTITTSEIVPEPATASLSLLGLAALMIRRRR